MGELIDITKGSGVPKEQLDELTDKLFEQKGKLTWLVSQVPINEEQKLAIKEAGKLLQEVHRYLEGFGYKS